MELPRPWIPLEQDDELDEWTEDKVEHHIASVRTQIAQTEETLRARTRRIALDIEQEVFAEQMEEALADAEQDSPPDVAQQADNNREQLDDMTIADWHRGAQLAERLKHLHDEAGYGQAWLSACGYLHELEHEAFERLMNAIEQIKSAASQVTFLPQSVVVLALPSGDEHVDLHFVQEQTLTIGEQLIEEKTEFTVIYNGGKTSKGETNVVLKAAFKVAQFAYYAGVLAHYAGDALKQVLAHFHHILEHFLPMLSAVAKAMA